MTMNNPAPALTPRMPGSASGFRVTPWITAPARPNAAPASRPTIVRGMRDSVTIRSSVEFGSGLTRACNTVPNEMSRAPMARLSSAAPARAAAITTSPVVSTAALR